MAIGLGLIGCGGFGRWCLEQYRALDDVTPVACFDVHADLDRVVASDFGIAACTSEAELLARTDVDFVHIATPPWAHAESALAALEAGKHVLCEKPIATCAEDARRMSLLAREKGLVLSANLIMRYDPLCQTVKDVLDAGSLGLPLYAEFINCAKDEQLGPDHWFWDPERSGGIFVEHGVHFFDLFAFWFGPGRVEGARQVVRPGTDRLVEQVACQARFGDVLCHFYHGFTQAERMDRQEIRIVCERGDIHTTEWVPTTIVVDGLLTLAELGRLERIVPNASTEVLARYAGAERTVTSRHKRYEVDGRFHVSGDLGVPKMDVYAQAARALLADQVAAIRDPEHRRKVTDENGATSLDLALAARTFASA